MGPHSLHWQYSVHNLIDQKLACKMGATLWPFIQIFLKEVSSNHLSNNEILLCYLKNSSKDPSDMKYEEMSTAVVNKPSFKICPST